MKHYLSILVVAVILVLVFCFPLPASASGEFTRLAGSDRYATAVEVSAAGWDSASVVVLTRGDDFADALAGAPLAYALGAPILLTHPARLPAVTIAEIQRLGAGRVVVLGGEGAVADAVLESLWQLGLETERVYGPDRYATAAAIAQRLAPTGTDTVVVANGLDFPDALAAAPYAAALGYPILLVRPDSLPLVSEAAIEELGATNILVVGGDAVVADGLFAEYQRISGPNRFQTSLALARHFGWDSDKAFIATGYDFADAITGAALAARLNSGLLLVGKTVPDAAADFLCQQGLSSLVILGGERAISAELATALLKQVGLVGKHVEIIHAAVLTQMPGYGDVLRYPYAGYVSTVLDVSGEYVQIEFGRYLGWVHRDNIAVTAKEPDYIRLGWQFGSSADDSFLQQPPRDSGYNVYAPVMFYVDHSGLKMYSGRNYTANIKIARENGYQVWLTIAQFGTSPNLADETIPWIIDKALELDVDGINIDYEGMGSANRDAFTSFIDKLYAECKIYNLTLSVDVNRPSGNVYGASYDREALGMVSDYVILMAYDEHWSSSPQEGSVASHPWTRQSLEMLLAEVSAEKVILGIPFYTRNWVLEDVTLAEEDLVHVLGEVVRVRTEPTTEGGSATVLFLANKGHLLKYLTEVQGESIGGNESWYAVDIGDDQVGYISGFYSEYVAAGTFLGAKQVSSWNMGQRVALEIVENYDAETRTSSWQSLKNGEYVTRKMYNVDISYDEKSGQDVVLWMDGDGVWNKIWLENAMSLGKRLDLMREYGLSGLAAWSLDWMDSECQLWNMFIQ